MKKLVSVVLILVLGVSIWYVAVLISDRQKLEAELVRLHVVASTDSEHDQSVKLVVRDAVLEYLDTAMDGITNSEDAKDFIRSHLPEIQQVANHALQQLGQAETAVVSFMKEEFPVRDYDTFSLPSGIYDSLRIVIGEGTGKNWWCVVFPKMCYGAASVKDVTADAGFSDDLNNAITGNYHVRFFFLDVLGRVENFLHCS